MSWEIKRYEAADKAEWDAFVGRSRNATFLFSRGYVDYHADRFADHSLMARRNGRLAAILPANIEGTTLVSHRGLTYGGWALAPRGLDTTAVFLLWQEWLRYCRAEGIDRVIYKPLPTIYASMPSQEDLYMLFLCGASATAVNISSTIDLARNPGFNTLQKRHLAHVPRGTVIECGSSRLDEFYVMLSACLAERHGSKPVHTLAELHLLLSRFPENIHLWSAVAHTGDLRGGVLVYETSACAHCQYIATTPEGRDDSVLSLLFREMIGHYTAAGMRFLDFGTSNEEGGRLLNEGLNRQKSALGGSGVAYAQFEFSVSSASVSMPSELWPPR